jgi:hypothetical protein
MSEITESLGFIRRIFSVVRNYAEARIYTEDLLIALIFAGTAICILSFLIGIFNRRTRRKWLTVSLSGFIVALISFFLLPLPEESSTIIYTPSPTYKAPTKPKYPITYRKRIFLELVKADDTAQIEALKEYPLNPRKLGQYRDKLKELYRKKVRDKYGITKEQADRIYLEGETKNWPVPLTE